MSGWRAIVPLNLGGACKTRLSPRLSPWQRERLVEAMARHVIERLAAASAVDEIAVLSPRPPPFPRVEWLADRGGGLNAELARALGGGRVIVIHADLPLLAVHDIAALAASAENAGAALAPDRAGRGTNALALTSAGGFRPRFGRGSFALHREALPAAAIVARPGLAGDVDTVEDLDRVLAAGAAIAAPI
ncbi:MAG: 2-phospho-L-lactate guanylyltransferase [Novosphingobium sp.]